MIKLYLLDLLALFAVGSAIWNILPEDFREELGSLLGVTIEIIWVVFWIIYFPILGHHIQIT